MSKYHSRITEYEGIKFHSAKEARRYQELRLLEKAGEIQFFERQVPYNLEVRGQKIGEYRADFVYCDKTRGYIVEDVKGMDTPLSKWKRRHVNAQYGIVVQLT